MADSMEVFGVLEESSDSADSHVSSISVAPFSPLLDDAEMGLLMDEWQEVLKDRLQNLKEQYFYLKEMLEKEKKQVLATKFEKVRSTNEKEYQESLTKLKQNLDEKMKVIEKTHECRLKMTELKYDAEKLSIRQQFEEDKKSLYERIKSDLEEKIKTEAQKAIQEENVYERQAGITTGIKTEPVVVNGPYIVYRLNDDEIEHDSKIIKKALLWHKIWLQENRVSIDPTKF